jgi:hypothetical protein
MKGFATTIGWTTGIALGFLFVGCGGGGGKKLTPEQSAAAGALCDKFAGCSGETVSSSDMQQCKEQMAGALQIIPDPQEFTQCVDGLTCSQVEDSTSIRSCVDLDTSTIYCTGASTLHACSNSGKCTSISCPDVCALVDATFDHCGYDSDRGWDVCWCVL